jgi:hypothetical protein
MQWFSKYFIQSREGPLPDLERLGLSSGQGFTNFDVADPFTECSLTFVESIVKYFFSDTSVEEARGYGEQWPQNINHVTGD